MKKQLSTTEQLDKLFYNNDKSFPTLNELIESSGFNQDVVKSYYNAQEIVQLTKRPHPKSKLTNHFNISIPHERYECDLLFLPTDKGYKYCMTVIDAASRYKYAIPIKNKQANTLVNAWKVLEKQPNYKHPVNLVVDNGSEFKGAFKKYIESLGINLVQNSTGNHLAFVERFNGVLSVLIFRKQQIRELSDKKTNTEWVDELPGIIKDMNDRKTRMIKMAPIKAVKMEEVPQPKTEHSKADSNKKLPVGTQVRYVLNSDEIMFTDSNKKSIEKRRLTDLTHSRGIYKVISYRKDCDRCLYYHSLSEAINGEYPHPGRSFSYFNLLEV